MTPTETVSRLRRLADDWRKEEKQLCEQFGNEIIPRSMRARRIKDAQAISAAVGMIERMGRIETVLQDHHANAMCKGCDHSHPLTQLLLAVYQQSKLYADTVSALEKSK